MIQPAGLTTTTMRTVVANEADEHSGALPGLTLDVVRTGIGYGPNLTDSYVGEHVTVVSGLIQFPLLGRTTVGDDTIIVALITSAPPSSRWAGIELRTGSLLLYGPGAEHTAVSPAGLRYSAALVSIGALEEAAERRGMGFTVPKRGRVVEVDSTQHAVSLAELLRTASEPLDERGATARSEVLLYSIGTMHSHGVPSSHGPGRRVLDSRNIAGVCVEYVDADQETSSVASIERRPTIAELCMVAHVSERRLRNAFYDSYGVAPLRYFRLRSMSRARNRLLDQNACAEAVPGLALELGYDHLSRFVSYYKDVYGESPSATAALT